MGGALSRMIGFQGSPLPPAPTVVSTSTFTSSSAGASWTVFSGLDLSNCDIAAALVFVRTGSANPTLSIDAGSSSGWGAIGTGTTFGGNIGGFASTVIVIAKSAPTASETLIVNCNFSGGYGAILYRTAGGDTITQAGANGTSGSANPPNLNNGSVHNTLWLALGAVDGATAPTALPSGFANGISLTSGLTATSTVASILVGDLTSSAQSQDPGTFTNTSARWGAKTVSLYHT